ncbi:hypothetical protein GOV14_05230 [Candidatus Pacearchaeota archaeon]|nr:hypothetical protein [Candidatus Pacearchaeota archaeon]
MKSVKRLFIITFLISIVCFSSLSFILGAMPYGATPSEVSEDSSSPDTAQTHGAWAGNVTEITIVGFSTTTAWQGYYGNVSGTVQLADSDDNIMYNWTLASPEGEVFAATNDSLSWLYVQCFNFSATGSKPAGDENATKGNTSQYGMNLSEIETFYNITTDDVDGINETFDLNGSLEGTNGTHDLFYVNSLEFEDGECLSTNVRRNNRSEDNFFEEVLLYDPVTDTPIFVSLLEEVDTTGFDGKYHDFQMIVPENGKGTDLQITPYYFYVELE